MPASGAALLGLMLFAEWLLFWQMSLLVAANGSHSLSAGCSIRTCLTSVVVLVI